MLNSKARVGLKARFSILISALLLASPALSGQWDMEIDPAAYGMHGASFHMGRESNEGNVRLQLGYTGFHVPEAYHDQENFRQRIRSISAMVDYFFAGHTRGFFAGVHADYAQRNYRDNISLQSETRRRGSIGPRIGYRWEFGDYWYLTPWVSANYIIDANDVVVAERVFEQREYDIRPAIHLGWRF